MYNQLELPCERQSWAVIPFLQKLVTDLKAEHAAQNAQAPAPAAAPQLRCSYNLLLNIYQ